jgi:AraC-like DNA-binding protein
MRPGAGRANLRAQDGRRQDLLDPDLRDRPVSAVGARWGFHDAAAFSRAFRASYGVSPGECCAAQLSIGVRARG